jgi:hypothetical protein
VVSDVAGVDQPGLEPGGLQHVERGAPVAGGRLHDHTGDPEATQVVGQVHEHAGGGLVGGDLLQPPPRLVRVGDAYAAGQFGLADVERGDPLGIS